MKLPFFASFIVFLIVVSYQISKSRRYTEKMENSFWERELKANNTRRKSLEHLNYITIPFETLPMSVMTDDESVLEYQQTLRSLAGSPIVNFTGISNTDLKLQYGAPNIDLLMRGTTKTTQLLPALYSVGRKNYMRRAILPKHGRF